MPTRRQFGGALLGAAILGPAALRAALADDRPHLHRVTIRGFAFEPETLTIRAGDSVEWTSRDIAPHTATALEGDWDTGQIGRGETATVAFPRPGRHAYLCAFHPRMRAEVIVEDD